jgi:hypothetical protein
MSEEQTEEASETPATEESSSSTESRSSAESSNSTESGDSGSDSDSSELETSGPGEIGDDKLPPDLQPTEDNPLARHPGQTGEDDDKIGADTEGGDAANPSANMAYSAGEDNAPSDAPGESDNAEVKAEEDDGSETLDNGGGGAG